MSNEYESFYPPKPFLEKETPKPGHLAVTVFSIVLFSLVFLFFFDQHFDLLLQLLTVLILHELGHFLMMKLFRYENVRMLFIPLLGAFVHGRKEEYKQRDSIFVILAGPIPGIVLALALGIIGVQQQTGWMVNLAFLSFLLNVLNLLPLLPLDGGRLLNTLFFEHMELTQLIFAFVSSLSIIGIGWWLDSYVLIGFGFFMGLQVRGMHRKYIVHRSLREANVDYRTSYENLTNRAYHFIKNEVLEHTPGLRRFLDESEDDSEEKTAIVAGEVSNMLIPPQIKDAGILFRIAVVIVWLAAIILPVYMILQENFLKLLSRNV